MAAEQQFCLRWNNHQSTLVSVFDTLLESGTLVDCTLAAEGQYLKAHKVVLSACSPYFELLLSQHYEKHPIIILKDVKFQELKAMMDYMYRGEVNISQDQLGALLKAAESLQIKGLSDSGGGGTEKEEPPEKYAEDKKQPATPARTPQTSHSSGSTAEQRRSAPDTTEDDSQPLPRGMSSREGSSSPVPRKRKKHRRRSSIGEEGGESNALQDSHDQTSSSSEQSQPVPNMTHSLPVTVTTVPSSMKSSAETVEHKSVKSEVFPSRTSVSQPPPPPPVSREPEAVQKVEPAEVLLEPKAEYLEEDVNEDSVEDLTLDDDDDLDMSMDHAQPGPSHGGEGSSQGYAPWHVGDQSRDEVFMAAQEAVGAHRDSQDEFSKNGMCGVQDEPAAVGVQESASVGHTATGLTLQGQMVVPSSVPNSAAVFVLPNFDSVQSSVSLNESGSPQVTSCMWQSSCSSMLIKTNHDPLKMIIPIPESTLPSFVHHKSFYQAHSNSKKPILPRSKQQQQQQVPKFKFILPKPTDQVILPNTVDSCNQPAVNVLQNFHGPDIVEKPIVIQSKLSPQRFESSELDRCSLATWPMEREEVSGKGFAMEEDPLQGDQVKRDDVKLSAAPTCNPVVSLPDLSASVDVKPPVHLFPVQQPFPTVPEACIVKTEPGILDAGQSLAVDTGSEENATCDSESFFSESGLQSLPSTPESHSRGMLLTRSMTRGTKKPGPAHLKKGWNSAPQISFTKKRTRGPPKKMAPWLLCPHCNRKFKSQINLETHVKHLCLVNQN